MKIFKGLLVAAGFILQTSSCFAAAENAVNIILAPDPITYCSTYAVEVAITENSTLAIVPQNCTSRPSVGLANNQVTNKFDRIGVNWFYYLQGAINGGYFMGVAGGVENVEYTSVAGSSAKVQFIDVAIGLGYQWLWSNGFNIDATLGIAHLMRNSLDQSITSVENIDVINFLDKQTSTNTHPGIGVTFGWAF